MNLRDGDFGALEEKTKEFNAMVDLFKQAFPQDVLDSGDWGEAKLVNILPALKALKSYVDKWNMGNKDMYVSNLKLICKEMTNTMYATDYSPELEKRVDEFVEHVNDLRLLHENPILKSGQDAGVQGSAPEQP